MTDSYSAVGMFLREAWSCLRVTTSLGAAFLFRGAFAILCTRYASARRPGGWTPTCPDSPGIRKALKASGQLSAFPSKYYILSSPSARRDFIYRRTCRSRNSSQAQFRELGQVPSGGTFVDAHRPGIFGGLGASSACEPLPAFLFRQRQRLA